MSKWNDKNYLKEYQNEWRNKNRDKFRKYQKEYKKIHEKPYREKLRREVLTHYGGKCACCGFDDLYRKIFDGKRSFLEIDLINGGHNKLVREGKLPKIGNMLCLWLRKNNYPDGFRVLCKACNSVMEPNEKTCELHKWEQNERIKLVG